MQKSPTPENKARPGKAQHGEVGTESVAQRVRYIRPHGKNSQIKGRGTMDPVSIELEAERQALIATMSKWREELRTLSQLLDTMRSALDAEEVRIIMAACGYSGLSKNDAERKLAASQLLIANGSYQKAKSAVSAATPAQGNEFFSV
jgi:Xaa-Pro aminopeptidase